MSNLRVCLWYFFTVSMAQCRLNSIRRENMWNWFSFTTKHLSQSECSHCCLNVIFHYIPPDEGKYVFLWPWKNKTLARGWVYDCLLSFFISLCKHCCVRGISLSLDAWVHFSFMPRFPETHTKSDTLAAHSQTVRAEQRRHLWWSELKSLWCCASLWGWFQLLCALQGCSSYGLSHQIRNGTYTPLLFLNNQHIVFSSCLSTTQHICSIMYGLLRGNGEEGWRIQGGK